MKTRDRRDQQRLAFLSTSELQSDLARRTSAKRDALPRPVALYIIVVAAVIAALFFHFRHY